MPCHLLALIHCVLSSPKSTLEILENFMLPSSDRLDGGTNLFLQQDLTSAHSAKTATKWFAGHYIVVVDWPANSPDMNPLEPHMVYCQEADETNQN